MQDELWLRQLTEAAITGTPSAADGLAELRNQAAQQMGEQQMVDALTVAAAFNGITKVADATGIPLDDSTAQRTAQMRQTTGINDYDYAVKSARWD